MRIDVRVHAHSLDAGLIPCVSMACAVHTGSATELISLRNHIKLHNVHISIKLRE